MNRNDHTTLNVFVSTLFQSEEVAFTSLYVANSARYAATHSELSNVPLISYAHNIEVVDVGV